jgi:hypothetical protein
VAASLQWQSLKWQLASVNDGGFMKTNAGTMDRAIRLAIGLFLLSLVFVGPQTPWGWLGVIPLVTGLVGFCPLYLIVGLDTCPVPSKKK